MYDVKVLKTLAECRRVMERARKQNNEEFYQLVFRRLCELGGHEHDDPADPLVRDFYATLTAYEQLLTEKNGKTTSASRTRQKLKNKGVEQSLIDWAMKTDETPGFNLLVKAGLYQFTGEYVVLQHSDRFPTEVIERAKARLTQHGVPLP